METVYCLDTSGWTGFKRNYPAGNFPSLWQKLDSLSTSGFLISPSEVYGELEKQEDELFKWLKQRKQIFQKISGEDAVLTTEILAKYPRLVNSLKPGPVADPFVIALAIIKNRDLLMVSGTCIVVSSEIPGGSKKTKIPDVCSGYKLKHFSVVDLISNEGWIF